ncbi:hypothetical protein Dimus_001836 [Dionaea muscipula]
MEGFTGQAKVVDAGQAKGGAFPGKQTVFAGQAVMWPLRASKWKKPPYRLLMSFSGQAVKGDHRARRAGGPPSKLLMSFSGQVVKGNHRASLG